MASFVQFFKAAPGLHRHTTLSGTKTLAERSSDLALCTRTRVKARSSSSSPKVEPVGEHLLLSRPDPMVRSRSKKFATVASWSSADFIWSSKHQVTRNNRRILGHSLCRGGVYCCSSFISRGCQLADVEPASCSIAYLVSASERCLRD